MEINCFSKLEIFSRSENLEFHILMQVFTRLHVFTREDGIMCFQLDANDWFQLEPMAGFAISFFTD